MPCEQLLMQALGAPRLFHRVRSPLHGTYPGENGMAYFLLRSQGTDHDYLSAHGRGGVNMADSRANMVTISVSTVCNPHGPSSVSPQVVHVPCVHCDGR